jgi:hypothetical protein
MEKAAMFFCLEIKPLKGRLSAANRLALESLMCQTGFAFMANAQKLK